MSQLKPLAVYLPQFHRTPENDAWWGEGFTEWTAVKAAKPLYAGHNQPRVPLNQNYYNLLEKQTMQWQAELAHKYGIYGFCFYHYYFKDGRKILESPAENLLKWKDIDINFCFSWANETWARTWSNVSGSNTWAERFESQEKSGDGILLQQAYGGPAEWEAHFNYLLPFFKDDRYIKIDGKPVFLFYKPADIGVLPEMLACWEKLARQNDFPGLYSIAVNYPGCEGTTALLLQGPNAYHNITVAGQYVEEDWTSGIRMQEYEKIWQNAIECNVLSDKPVYYGAFVDYDDTPRRGNLGTVLNNAKPEIFEKYARQLAIKNLAAGNEFLFINAWNEWAEGNYLEPDEAHGYRYLEAIQHITAQCNAPAFDVQKEWMNIAIPDKQQKPEQTEALLTEIQRYKQCYYILDRWLLLEEHGQTPADYFTQNGFKKILIYGFAAMGRHLYNALCSAGQQVCGIIDRRSDMPNINCEIISPNNLEKLPPADIMVVTVAKGGKEIAEDMQNKTGIKAISLYEVVFGISIENTDAP